MATTTNLPEEPKRTKPPASVEMHPGPGFRIRHDFPRLDPETVAAFAQYDTAEISDLLNRLYALDAGVGVLSGGGRRLVGLACTVRIFPGDNLMVHKSLDIAHRGDVVVVAASGVRSNAVAGDISVMKAIHRGIAGFVVDGLIRDLPAIRALDYPIYALGSTTIGPLHRGPGEINYPVACAGVVVNPGDIVVADDAGVVIVPQEVAHELLVRLAKQRAVIDEMVLNVREGNFNHILSGSIPFWSRTAVS